jgi:CubicO group peptidase (beta-lactamase class C family)
MSRFTSRTILLTANAVTSAVAWLAGLYVVVAALPAGLFAVVVSRRVPRRGGVADRSRRRDAGPRTSSRGASVP